MILKSKHLTCYESPDMETVVLQTESSLALLGSNWFTDDLVQDPQIDEF